MRRFQHAPALLLLLLLSSGSGACLAADHGSNCEAIRTQIDAKVRASGTTDYAVTVVGANAKVAGKVVGSCDLGTKKIVYARSGPAALPAAAATPPRETGDDDIITECKDGRVVRGGDCSGTANAK